MAASVLIQGVELSTVMVPLHRVYLHSDLITGPVVVGIRPTLPVKGVSFVLGNDLAGGKVKPNLWVMEHPDQFVRTEADNSAVFPAYVVTRATAQKAKAQDKEMPNPENIEASLLSNQPNCHTKGSNPIPTSEAENSNSVSNNLSFSREQLIRDQEMDAEISCLAEGAISEEEAADNPKCYYKKSGVLTAPLRCNVPLTSRGYLHALYSRVYTYSRLPCVRVCTYSHQPCMRVLASRISLTCA